MHEWVGGGDARRQAMIPAADLSRHPVRVLTDDEVDALTVPRWQSWEWVTKSRGLAQGLQPEGENPET